MVGWHLLTRLFWGHPVSFLPHAFTLSLLLPRWLFSQIHTWPACLLTTRTSWLADTSSPRPSLSTIFKIRPPPAFSLFLLCYFSQQHNKKIPKGQSPSSALFLTVSPALVTLADTWHALHTGQLTEGIIEFLRFFCLLRLANGRARGWISNQRIEEVRREGTGASVTFFRASFHWKQLSEASAVDSTTSLSHLPSAWSDLSG